MKVGILGAGNIATSMATAINGLPDDYELYAVASRDIEKARKFSKDWNVERAYGSYEEMLSDDNIDMVYVATPHSHHLEHTKLCIEYGKSALVEKSFTANAEQAKEVLQMAEERNILVTEAIWTRYMPSRALINEVIESGLIGNVTKVTADLSYPISHIKRNYLPELAGGALLDLGVYPINFASMILGDELTGIDGTCTYFDTGVDSQDSITLTYQNGAMATLSAGFYTGSPRIGTVYGTKGYINVLNINNPQKIVVYDNEYNMVKDVPVPKQINGYEYEVIACKRALENGQIECTEMPHKETVRVMKVMDTLRNKWGIKYPFE